MQNLQKLSTEVMSDHSVYTFKREEGRWYIYLPAFLNQGFTRFDLEMTEGAHKLLNCLSKGARKIRLWMSLNPFAEADVLELVEICEAPKGGAFYLFTPQNNQPKWEIFWICDLALLVFGDLPQRIYVQRLAGRTKRQEAEGRQWNIREGS